MTDFIVSKVVMSICALMIVTVLGGMFAESQLFDSAGELESVLSSFCRIADELALSGGEARADWRVPFKSSGEVIEVRIDRSVIRAESGSENLADQPTCGIHTWRYDGRTMNSTELQNLDESSQALEGRSGEILTLTNEMVMVDNQPMLFVFVRVAS